MRSGWRDAQGTSARTTPSRWPRPALLSPSSSATSIWGEDFTDRALDLNQNLAWGWLFSGLVKIWMGEPEVACQRIALALSLSPHDPHTFNMHGALAWAHYAAYRYRDALAFADMALREKPNRGRPVCEAASAALGGEIDRARMSMAGLRQLYPSLRLSTLRKSS